MSSVIAKLSPLSNYWSSDQDEMADKRMSQKANLRSKDVKLFLDEPYKWEILFHLTLEQLIDGDMSYIKSLQRLLQTINQVDRNQILSSLKSQAILNSEVIQLIELPTNLYNNTNFSFKRFLKVLIAIFTNPYKVNINRSRANQIYEITGFLFNQIK